ncbi:MAG: dTMP kinase [Armatimonadetes bacterium]|nr:dTMP kinase [Armatimonadota bacterium]
MKGLFITLEGPEGAGKSLQTGRLAERLRASGREVVLTREPGGTPAAEVLRSIALETPLHPRAELLVFLAARAEHVERLIRPALSRGAIVLCDRFIDSTVAYQGYGLGLDPEQIRSLNAYATDGLLPDLTLVLDIPPLLGFSRRGETRGDNIERREDSFHERLREGFLAEARREPERIRVVDGTAEVEAVAERIWDHIAPWVSRSKPETS